MTTFLPDCSLMYPVALASHISEEPSLSYLEGQKSHSNMCVSHKGLCIHSDHKTQFLKELKLHVSRSTSKWGPFHKMLMADNRLIHSSAEIVLSACSFSTLSTITVLLFREVAFCWVFVHTGGMHVFQAIWWTVDSSTGQVECEQETCRIIKTGCSFPWRFSLVLNPVKVSECSFSCREEVTTLKNQVMHQTQLALLL